MRVYERMEPEGRCVAPDGHECVEIFQFGDAIPVDARCPRCGKAWTILMFDE